MIPVYQFHIAFTLKKYSFLSIGKVHQYTEEADPAQTVEVFNRMGKLIKENKRIVLALTGTFIEHLQEEQPALVAAIKSGLNKDQIILLGTTYHASLASLYSPGLFKEQIRMHQDLVKKVFDYQTLIFYNTATLYFDKLAPVYQELGISTAVAPVSEWHLNGRHSNIVFKGRNDLNLILLAGESLGSDQIGEFDEETLELVSENSAKGMYRVPQPIYSKSLVRGKTLSSNALQTAVHQKIIYLKKKLKKQKRTDLYHALSLFTAVDFFDMLTKTDDQNNREPYEHYANLMNVLTDFEWVNKI